jgi:thiol-disulfide isomerase/thioredoxin
MKKVSNTVLRIMGILMLVAFSVAGCSSCFNEPEKTASSSYEVLEPSSWVGRELPILEYINIAEKLRKGTWLVLFYHYDCPDCDIAIPKYEQMARDMSGNGDFMRIALIAVPPYGRCPVGENSTCTLGRLADIKQWFITTPTATLLTNGRVKSAWEKKAPNLETILRNIVIIEDNNKKFAFCFNKSLNTFALDMN